MIHGEDDGERDSIIGLDLNEILIMIVLKWNVRINLGKMY